MWQWLGRTSLKLLPSRSTQLVDRWKTAQQPTQQRAPGSVTAGHTAAPSSPSLYALLLFMLSYCSEWKQCTEPAQVPRAAGSTCSACHKRCPILLPAGTGLAHTWGHDGELHKPSTLAFVAQNPNVSFPLNTWSSTSAH